MGLYWDCKNVENFDEKDKNENFHSFLTALIYASMSIGMRVLTKDNIDEWVYRLNRLKFDNYRWMGKEDNKNDYYKFLTVEDLTPFIGLRTNVSTMSNKDFDDLLRSCPASRRKSVTLKQLDSNPKDWKPRNFGD